METTPSPLPFLEAPVLDALPDLDEPLVDRAVVPEVVLELAWVLERTYGIEGRQIADALDGLIAAREIMVETGDDIAASIAAWRDGGAGLGDRMIVAAAQRAGARTIVTFDRKAARIPEMQLLE